MCALNLKNKIINIDSYVRAVPEIFGSALILLENCTK